MKKLFLLLLISSCINLYAPIKKEFKDSVYLSMKQSNHLQKILKNSNTIIVNDYFDKWKIKKGKEKQLLEQLITISKENNLEIEWLLKVITSESGGNPEAVNIHSGAVGIIQFLNSTLKYLGYTRSEVLEMDIIEQLEVLKKYLVSTGQLDRIKSYEDLYMAIFLPSMVGKHDNNIIAGGNSLIYKQNKGIDRYYGNNDGILHVKEFKKFANRKI